MTTANFATNLSSDRGESWPCSPPKVMKNAVCPATALYRSGPSPPCHPDRSEAQWRDLLFRGPRLGMFFDRAYPDFLPRCARETANAPLRKERRMKFAEATEFHRKSGGA